VVGGVAELIEGNRANRACPSAHVHFALVWAEFGAVVHSFLDRRKEMAWAAT